MNSSLPCSNHILVHLYIRLLKNKQIIFWIHKCAQKYVKNMKGSENETNAL